MRISTQNIACSQRQMNACHTSFSYILWAYGEHIMSKWSSRTSDQFIWLVSEKKTEAVKAYLIKNSMGEGGGGGVTGGGDWSEGSRKDWAELYVCIKQVSNDQSLFPSLISRTVSVDVKHHVYLLTSHCNGNHSKTSVSLSVWERQRTRTRTLKLYFTRIVV